MAKYQNNRKKKNQGKKAQKKKTQKKKQGEKKQGEENEKSSINEEASKYCLNLQNTQSYRKEVEKYWNKKGSQDKIVLKNYSSALHFCFLQVITTIYQGVDPIDILEFINSQYTRFLVILRIMMEDDDLPKIYIDMSRMNSLNSIINKEILRSFSFGLKKLRERKGLNNLETTLELDEIDIRCLFISQLLLIGVGQIPSNIKEKEKKQSQEHFFHRILTYLLTSKNQILTIKLLYLLNKKWNQIMKIIYDQLEKDKQERPVQNSEQPNGSQNKTTLRPLSQAEKKALNEQQQKRDVKQSGKKQCYCRCHYQKQENSDQNYFYDETIYFLKSDQRNHDYEHNIFKSAEKKHFYKKKQERNQFVCCSCYGKKQKTEQNSDKIDEQKPKNLKEKYYHPQNEDIYAVRVSEKVWNYRQANTLERNNVQKGKKIKKDQKKQVTSKKTNKGKQKMEYKKTQHSYSPVSEQLQGDIVNQVVTLGEEKSIMDRGMIYSQGLESYQESDFQINENSVFQRMGMRNQGSSENIQMLEKGVMNMHVESENVQTVNNQVKNTQSQQQQSSATNNKTKPKESVKHSNRQIDYLVYSVITNRECVIETIANHIYYELLVWNVTLKQPQPDEPTEKKDSFSKNLFNQQQK